MPDETKDGQNENKQTSSSNSKEIFNAFEHCKLSNIDTFDCPPCVHSPLPLLKMEPKYEAPYYCRIKTTLPLKAQTRILYNYHIKLQENLQIITTKHSENLTWSKGIKLNYNGHKSSENKR